MAKNHVQPGKTLTWKNTTAAVVYSGSVVVMGDIIGITLSDVPAGESGTVQVEEVWELPNSISTAVDLGTRVFWDTGSKKVVAAEGAGIVAAGYAAADAAAGASKIKVKINA